MVTLPVCGWCVVLDDLKSIPGNVDDCCHPTHILPDARDDSGYTGIQQRSFVCNDVDLSSLLRVRILNIKKVTDTYPCQAKNIN